MTCRPPRVLVAAALVFSLGAAQPQPDPYAWIERLGTWITALEHHVPGELDEAEETVAAWHRLDLELFWLDANAFVGLVLPGVRIVSLLFYRRAL